MDVEEIVISEFKTVFERHGYTVDQRYLTVAKSPFNLKAVQQAVDADIRIAVRESRSFTLTQRIVAEQRRERHHKEELKKLSREYALKILRYARQGQSINESMMLSEQRSLKEEAGAGCDVYPCAQQNRAR